ncbi:unnamed protein product [Chironomus riparius]|uniref:F-box domain-containing protein n=1 Tax=Chironomus riparius TaxID=315576 RepID=A0A9N9S7D5_9DIPT|nr:unnamed protein product [Chironomus riparius]
MQLKSYNNLKIQDLPSEVIINCLSFLKVEDLQNCRLVSHQFNNFIVNSPQIMQNFKFNLQFGIISTMAWIVNGLSGKDNVIKYYEDLHDLWRFVRDNGKSIRCVEVILTKNDKFKWFFLKHLPNLECLIFNGVPMEVPGAITSFFTTSNDLSKLTTLKINLSLLNSFMSSTKNVNKLEKLTVYITSTDDQELLTNFIKQQKNLKVLSIKCDRNLTSINFPSSDITSKVKFQLKQFKLYQQDIRNQSEHFLKFIESQAGHLESLSFDFNPDEQLYKVIMTKCRNLKNLEFQSDDEELFINLNPNWTLPSLRAIACAAVNSRRLDSITARFPNVNKLICRTIENIDKGTYDKITDIKAVYMDGTQIDVLAYPNLKSLCLETFTGSVENWMKLTENLENLSILIVKFRNETDFDLKHLDHMRKLKSVNFKGQQLDCANLRKSYCYGEPIIKIRKLL